MFPETKRNKQALNLSECEKILASAHSGVIAVAGCNGYPYDIPLNHVYINGKIYFHCAGEGHKINSIRLQDKVCFSVVAEKRVLSEKLATHFLSVDIFGHAKLIEDTAKKREFLIVIAQKFSSDFMDKAMDEITTELGWTKIIEITPEHITGKMSGDVLIQREKV